MPTAPPLNTHKLFVLKTNLKLININQHSNPTIHNYNKQSHLTSNLNRTNELALFVAPNANPDAIPFAQRIFNSTLPNAGNNRETPVTAVSVNEERSTKNFREGNKKKRQQSETQPSLFPLTMARRRSQFFQEMENIAIRRIID